MTQEMITDLRTNVVTGLGHKAWHFNADDEASRANYYGDDPVPFSAVESLLDFPVEKHHPLNIITDGGIFTDESRCAILRPDTGRVLAVHGDTYPLIPYADTLLRDTSAIVGDTLVIGSAGVLKGGAVAWVQVESPEVRTVGGVDFRTWVMATTSHDGTLSRIWQKGTTVVVCDNTHAAFMSEGGKSFRVKKTSKQVQISGDKIIDARIALDMVQAEADAFDSALRGLLSERVSDDRFNRWMSEYNPTPDKPGRGRTMADNKASALKSLWTNDARCTPWRGTAWGVVQVANTYAHHIGTVKGATRDERNALRNMSGEWADVNAEALRVLSRV